MRADTALLWKRRFAFVYAVSAWTVLGTCVYYTYEKQLEKRAKKEEKEADDRIRVVYEGTYSTTVITYKKDFVPYTTRIYNFFKSFSGGDK